jgi:hypothetical protein
MRREIIIAILFFGLMLSGGFFAPEVSAATRTVDTTSDSGALTACTGAANDCSLRGAINNAAAGDTINFAASLTNATITLGSEILLVRNITITGLGADKLTISGGGTARIFSYFGGSTLNFNLSGLTLANGSGSGADNGNQGGAMHINGGATTTTFDGMVFRNNTGSLAAGALLFAGGACRISNSTFTNNSSSTGTVIYFISGSLEITNSTFSGNTGSFSTIYSFGRPVIIRNSTIVNNPGGGLYKDAGTLTLGNTIVAGNGGYDLSRNGGSAINTNGGNLIGSNNSAGPNFASAGQPNANADYVGTSGSPINPLLGALGNYGGTTPMYSLLSGSPAINHGNNCVVNNSCSPAIAAALTTDQRGAGFPRQVGVAVDIGAFEGQIAPTAATVSVSGRVLTPDGSGLTNARVILTDVSGSSRTVSSSSFGYYRFDDVRAGEVYILSVASKRYLFTPQAVTVLEEINDLNFSAVP